MWLTVPLTTCGSLRCSPHVAAEPLTTCGSLRCSPHVAHCSAGGVQRREVLLKQRPSVSYDVLSIDVGITPRLSNVPGAREHTTPVKPISGCVANRSPLPRGGGGFWLWMCAAKDVCSVQCAVCALAWQSGREGSCSAPVSSQLAVHGSTRERLSVVPRLGSCHTCCAHEWTHLHLSLRLGTAGQGNSVANSRGAC
jgi:hypothetical protein